MSGKILAKQKCEIKEDEIQILLKAYDDRDTTITKGFIIEGVHFEVHRFHPPLIFGRIANEELNEGVCLVKGKNDHDEIIFMLITYLLPIVSARAIP